MTNCKHFTNRGGVLKTFGLVSLCIVMLAVGFISSDISREDREEWAQVVIGRHTSGTIDSALATYTKTDTIYHKSLGGTNQYYQYATGVLGTFNEEFVSLHAGTVPVTAVINYANQFNDITTQLQSINTNLSALSTSVASSSSSSSSSTGTVALSIDNIPMVSVTVNANFDIPLSVYDDMQSGTSSDGKVQVVNSNVGDNLIHLKGRLSSVGIFQYKINGKVFNISVIENPTATNVVVRLE